MEIAKNNQLEKLREHYGRMGGLHHAYVFNRSTAETHIALLEFLERDLGMSISGNPDILSVSYETLGIDDAREIGERASRKALGDRKIFLIDTYFITVQAQNALLKVLEEPSPTTHFFILMPNADILLPTVTSRLMRIEINAGEAESVANEGTRSFLAQNAGERMAFLKVFLKSVTEEKDKRPGILFVDGLEEYIYAKAIGGRGLPHIAEALEEIELCRKYMYDTSASMKILLEHLASVLPRYE